MKTLVLAAAIALAGCATSYSPSGTNADAPITTSAQVPFAETDTAPVLRLRLSEKREELRRTYRVSEVDRLNREILALERRIAVLEERAAGEPRSPATPSSVTSVVPAGGQSSGSGPIQTGPRGGQYTISPSGKKQYLRRK